MAPAVPSPASRTFAEAMSAMRRGDYAGSADKLAQFAQTHADDARADEADYLLAIALQRAGRRDDAIAAAKRYLAARPKGAHRADAARIAGK
jgi:TolA-binding protein